MTIALPDLHQISFYSSPNLKEWTHLSNFGPAAEIGGCWECPDLFKLGNKWVLIVSLNPGGYQVGSGTQYFIGQWNGKEFIADDTHTRWLDYGRDNYAGVTFNDAPNNKRIFIGWMSNWEYAHKVPTDPWRSAMTLPRELTLEGDRLVQKVIPIKKLPSVKFSTSGGTVRISESADRYIEVGLADGKIFMNARNTWYEDLKFHRQEIATDKKIVDFEIYIDRGSIELFAEGGKVAITNLVFVDTALSALSSEGEILNLEVIELA
jgi:sucrose-6-phosphate hydrolase SacC (GH32 family)